MKKHAKADPVARTVRRMGEKKKASYVSDDKVQGIVQLESNLEATAVAACAIDPRISNIRPQPFSIDLMTGRRYASRNELSTRSVPEGVPSKTYTPDFLVSCSNGAEVCLEIKHSDLIDRDPSILEVPKLFKNLGLHLVIVSEHELTEKLAYNARLLRQYSTGFASEEDRELLLVAMKDARKLGDLIAVGLTQKVVMGGILNGTICVDLQRARIAPGTAFQAANGSTKHVEILPL